MSATRTGGQLLVDALLANNVDTAFCVPGESYLPVLDALYDARDLIRLLTCRQEGGVAFMTEAYGKLTGRPGVCFVTRGPGASNAAIGIHTAFQDSTPMLVCIGQVRRNHIDREAFQEIDYRRMFGHVAKSVEQIDQAARVPEYVNRAFATATSGRPGPVVLVLPEDMLSESAPAAPALTHQLNRPAPAPAQLQQLGKLLAESSQPVLIIGGFGWDRGACDALQAFAQTNSIPVAAAFRCQDLIDNRCMQYVGDVGIGINPKLRQRIEDADLLIVVGARLGEMTTGGYKLLEIPEPRQPMIHVLPGAEELGRVYQSTLAINSGLPEFCAALAELKSTVPAARQEWVQAARHDYETWHAVAESKANLNRSDAFKRLRALLPDDAIVTNGAGYFASALHRHFPYQHFRSQLAPMNGAMGYGLPAAIAAKAAAPERTVVCISGDGDFLMTGQELATAMQYRLTIVIIVFNNQSYGTIELHQRRAFPGRSYGTALENPDFVQYAKAFGAAAEAVHTTEEFERACERALVRSTTTLIEVLCED